MDDTHGLRATVTPFVQDADFKLFQGDALEVLRSLPDESVDCVVTSPPYWGLRDYGTGSWEGGDAGCDHSRRTSDKTASVTTASLPTNSNHEREEWRGGVCGKCGATRIDQQLGLDSTPEEYVARMVEVFREVRRVLSGRGTCWVNLGDSYASQGGPEPAQTKWQVDGASKTMNAGKSRTAGALKPKDLVGIPWRLAQALQAPYYTGRIKDERDRIWLAATIEAEGCLFIHKRKVGQSNGQGYERKSDTYGAGLEVSSTDRVIVERCMEIAGIGSICEQSPDQNARRKQTIYRWNVRSNECRWIIEELYPHFYAKQHEARLLIGCPSSGDDARKAWESLKAIHQGETATIDFDPPEPKWERGWFLRSDIIWSKPQPDAGVGDGQADEVA